MKNTKTTTAQKRFKRPQTSMMSVLQAQTLEKRHHFTTIAQDAPLTSKCSEVPQDAYRARPKDRSLDFASIVTTQQTVSWHSPTGGNFALRFGDLEFLRDVEQLDPTFGIVEQAWMGANGVCAALHDLQEGRFRPPDQMVVWSWPPRQCWCHRLARCIGWRARDDTPVLAERC